VTSEDNKLLKESPVHAYYSRDKKEDPQKFEPPLSNKYSESELEMLEKGIKRVSLEETLSLLY
jgi:hypothetical protein